MGAPTAEATAKLLEHLQTDLKNISLETKKRHPGVKESAEEAIVKIRNASLVSNFSFSNFPPDNSVSVPGEHTGDVSF